jgi:hypothetical protein
MCLHGLASSGQEHSVRRSSRFRGNSDTSAWVNTRSMSCGISPASSFATNSACLDRAWNTLSHSFRSSCVTPIVTVYGFGRDPWTLAVTSPAWMSIASTWPLRA